MGKRSYVLVAVLLCAAAVPATPAAPDGAAPRLRSRPPSPAPLLTIYIDASHDNARRRLPCPVVEWKYYTPDSADGAVWNTNLLDRRPVPNATELPLVVCPSGSTVEFRWSNSDAVQGEGHKHDVWELPSDAALMGCAFNGTGATELAQSSASGSLSILCDADAGGMGERYFACSVGGACAKGFQRVRVRVTDPTKTATLVSSGKATLANVFANDLITLTYNGHHVESEAQANRILSDLQSIAENAPQSCADWIPAAQNSEEACRAYAATDMGFMERVRPIPNYTAAEMFYAEAIRLQPTWCGAPAYMVELMLQREADAVVDGSDEREISLAAAAVVSQYRRACNVCAGSVGLMAVHLEFAKRDRNIPSCEAYSVNSTRSRNGTSDEGDFGTSNETILEAGLGDLSRGSATYLRTAPLTHAFLAVGWLVAVLDY
eukprot:g3260.t1